jgi:N-acetylneuraminate synthase
MTKIIAEIGINHNGELKIAKQLIDLAKRSGCDYVKFQKRDLNICIPKNTRDVIRQTPWGDISYIDYKRKIELSYDDYKEIDNYCKSIDIKWFASAWDLNSLDFLKKFELPVNKIASAMVINDEFIKAVAAEKKYTYISTGMCDLKDIDKVVNIFETLNCKYELMHCVSTYPCKETDLNLSLINFYKTRYKCPVGYSGHEDSVSPSIIAAVLGASSIERHITLSRSMFGTDQAVSLEEPGLKNLVQVIRKMPIVIGKPEKRFFEDEKIVAKKLRYWL